MDEHRGVATIVEDQVGAATVGPVEQLLSGPPVLLQRLALPGKHRSSVGGFFGAVRANGDCRRRVVLGREDVAAHPAHVGAEDREGLDQHGGLDRHV